MALQKTINGSLPVGIVGEFSDDSPKSARQFLTYGKEIPGSSPKAYEGGEFGKFYTLDDVAINSGSSDKTTVAKQGVAEGKLLGILVNPKEHYIVGFETAKKLAKDCISATIATRGHIYVLTKVSTVAGTPVYVDADGEFADADDEGATLVKGAYWCKTVTVPESGEKLAEIAIDNPELTAAEDETQSEDPEGTL